MCYIGACFLKWNIKLFISNLHETHFVYLSCIQKLRIIISTIRRNVVTFSLMKNRETFKKRTLSVKQNVDERLSDKVRYNWIRHILIIMLDVSSTSCYWWLTILSANAVNQNYFIIPLYIKCIPYLNNITIDWHIFIGYLPLPVDKTDKYMLFYLYLELFNKLSMVQSQLFHMGL